MIGGRSSGKRGLSIVAALLLVALTLAGCGALRGDNGSERNAAPVATADAGTSQQDTTGGGQDLALGSTPAAAGQASGDQAAGSAATGVAGPTSEPQSQPVAQAGSGGSASGQAAAPAAQPSLGDFSAAVRNVAERVRPAVVQITNEQVQLSQFGQVDVPAGVGSGVIYDKKGLIITNYHVIEGAQRLVVALPDERTFPAKVLGGDQRNDLAVLQIQADNLPVADLGNSGDLHVGDWVVAIGNALGLPGGPTVTAGVVSALGRTVQEPSSDGGPGPYLFDVVQTSAPINPGNSGGALVDLNGRVVGINTLVAGSAGDGIQAQGIGFAISIDTAKPIADQLATKGRVVHASMGIQYVPLTPGIAAQLGVNQEFGVVVMDVVPGSGAEAAGLQQGDIITSVDGKELRDESALARIINGHAPGDTITATVLRNGRSSDVKIKLSQAQ